MSPTIEEQLERYVTKAIMTQESGPPPPDSIPARRRPDLGGRATLLVALVVFALGVGIAALALAQSPESRTTAGVDLSTLAAPRTTVSVPGWRTLTELLESDLETSVTVYVRADAP